MTNVELLTNAHRLIGVVGESQTLSAEQGATSLTRLNQLMESLAVEEINIGYFAQTSTTDTCPIPAWAERGVTSRMGKDLLSIYPSAQLAPEFLDDATNGWAVIQRICMNQKLNPQSTIYLGLGSGWAPNQTINNILVGP